MKNIKNMVSRSRGFTLLELLVVISIIGILIAMMSAAFTTAQRKARDARRKSDIKTMQDGFEQYYANNNGYDSASTACATMLADTTIFPGGSPVDPKNNATYSYSCGADAAGAGYCVCAHLESGIGNADAGATVGSGSCSFTTGDYFCLTNLQ